MYPISIFFEHKIKEISLRQILYKRRTLICFYPKMVGEILGMSHCNSYVNIRLP